MCLGRCTSGFLKLLWFTCQYVCVSVCPPPQVLITIQWYVSDWLNMFYGFLNQVLAAEGRVCLVFEICHKAMVQPVLEYSSTVWGSSHFSQHKQIGSIQKSAVRLCYNTYSRFSSVSACKTVSVFLPYKVEGTKLNCQ